jgi:hypothetical protein
MISTAGSAAKAARAHELGFDDVIPPSKLATRKDGVRSISAGSLEAKHCTVSYELAGRTLALASISRDLENLRFEAAAKALRSVPPAIASA